MLYIDQFVYANKMRGTHPGDRFAFALATLAITVLVSQPQLHLAVTVVMISLLAGKARVPLPVIAKLFSIPATFLLLGTLTIALQLNINATDMLAGVRLGSHLLGVTETSLTTAAATLLKSLSAVSCLYFLVLTIPMTEIIHLLQRLRMPAVLLDLMMIIYRFIFVLVETAFHIYTAQSSRWGYAGFRRSINSFGLLFANLWAKSFMKSQAIFTSLLSRGYEGELHVIPPAYPWSKQNLLLFAAIDLSLIFTALYWGLLN